MTAWLVDDSEAYIGKTNPDIEKPLQFYRVVLGREPEDLWPTNPQFEMYGVNVRLGKRRCKRRVLKIPPPGRPRRESVI